MTYESNLPTVSIEREMKKSYLDYAMSVIIGRALPDVRDGLKPVHRRVLFAMRELKNEWNKPYKKSARIVGDVIGKYHPHGDSAVYDAIVRMAQDFSLRYPLVQGQGNFGSIDGDPPAAMRYTEVRMMSLAGHMLRDIEKDTVGFVPNYDESLTEPSVLPNRFPALLVNGSSGIAVGMATNIPPHNLSEIVAAVKALIENPEITIEELMELTPGPDFPTAGIIYGNKGIRDAYRTGRGVIRIRSKVVIEKNKRTGKSVIVVNELPYQVNKAKLIKKIDDMIKARQIEGVRYVRDESDRQGMRVAIALKKNQMPEVIVNQLYKQTRMEVSFGIILLAVAGKTPVVCSFKELLSHFVLHRKEVIRKRTLFDLNKAEARAHILEGLRAALDRLDEAVSIIRSSKTPDEARQRLMKALEITDIQARAILDMRLQRLTGLEREKILEEYEGLLKDIARYREILSNERLALNIIKDELDEIDEEYGDGRRSQIVSETVEIGVEDLIVEEDMVVTVSNTGYIKRNPVTLYHSQKRGGKGKKAMTAKEEDFIRHLFVASTHHTFLFFTNLGRAYWCKVYEIPMSGRQSRGSAVVNLLNLQNDEKLTTIVAVPSFDPGRFIMMATKNGLVKKTDIMAFSRPRAGGIIALNLVPGDELIAARLTDGDRHIFLGSASGKVIRFHESDIRPSGRIARGVRGMKILAGDKIVGMEVLSNSHTLLAVTENGYGKRTAIEEYTVRKRGGMGVITIKSNQRNGRVVSIHLVRDGQEMMLMTNAGKIIRIAIEDISILSRNTQGVRLIAINPDEKVVDAAAM